jgi:hypothetical protein
VKTRNAILATLALLFLILIGLSIGSRKPPRPAPPKPAEIQKIPMH